ncbi:MAG TPA: D-arabinose 5-phosphate isomerase [Gammaproteobacteria bacterium]|uniref:KpsF/GutQ family sugar-phosphate isomerase n=1 Tax=Immundisolibacter sp. TaxID=1934948 RepID=UPI000E856BF0|nr:D-arabinose 5-phosphate isomerase [Gammaproteobacteria bacterium]HCZ48268.1 D-arabinose 5-phosphate isomerase [Gammaproteobacteria bacterium]MCH77706.1 D-arabinose 5-phosphate isomerase [Gammaproteobacteria bacterium]
MTLPDTLPTDFDAPSLLQLARDVLDTEAEAIRQLAPRLGQSFVDACRLLLACHGRVVVLGMGKSGHIGSKIAATLASTGTPAFFVHPGEASHGDLGMITAQDVVLAMSNSGETSEILLILPIIRRLGVGLIAITGAPDSTLAAEADVHLDASVAREACPLGLAPTASTTATLALGDALAVALLQTRGFSREDFSRSHPGGKLGRRLLLHVGDVMVKGERMPTVSQDASVTQALLEITAKGLGMTAVVDAEGRAVGIFTDGDLRRVLEKTEQIRTLPITDVMTRGGVRIQSTVLAAEAAQLMQHSRINALLVEDADGRLVGALNMHTLLAAGVI